MEKIELKNYRALAQEVQQLRGTLRALENSLYSPKNSRYSHMPKAPGRAGSGADAIDRHLDLVAQYEKMLAAKEARQLAIERALDALEDPGERLVMRYRYIEGLEWKDIIAKLFPLGYSERQVYRLHGFALLNLKED